MKPIIPPVETSVLMAELEGHLLRPSNKAGNLIYDVTSHECPNVMREIARLREISYRDGGGATGEEMDIDEMDTMAKPYHQLIVLALALSDRILLMTPGKGIQLDTAENLRKKDAFTSAFGMDIFKLEI